MIHCFYFCDVPLLVAIDIPKEKIDNILNKKELINELSVDVKKYIFNHQKNASKAFFNDELDDIPYIIGAILEEQLHEDKNSWIEDNGKWIDDVLISKVRVSNNCVEFWGIVIWGKNKTTEQWTDPGYFRINFGTNTISKILILFKDCKYNSITYTKFNTNRNIWSGYYYSSSDYNPNEKEWEYKMEIKH